MEEDQLVKEYFLNRIKQRADGSLEMHLYNYPEEQDFHKQWRESVERMTIDDIKSIDVVVTDDVVTEAGTWFEGENDIVVSYQRRNEKGNPIRRKATDELRMDLDTLPAVLLEVAKWAKEREGEGTHET